MEPTATVRKADESDLDAIAGIYDRIHTAEEKGETTIGWIRGIYPERQTAEAALSRGDLFVLTDIVDGQERVVGTGLLNQVQVDVYRDAAWEYPCPDEEVMVMHTLVIDPCMKGKGYGRIFADYYETYAIEHGCHFLRIDTNERNLAARKFYRKLGYKEIGIVPCEFNGIPGVHLVLLEKKI